MSHKRTGGKSKKEGKEPKRHKQKREKSGILLLKLQELEEEATAEKEIRPKEAEPKTPAGLNQDALQLAVPVPGGHEGGPDGAGGSLFFIPTSRAGLL